MYLVRQVNTSHILVMYKSTIFLKKEDKVLPDIEDLYNQNMGVLTCLIKSCSPMYLNQSQNHGQKMFYSTFLYAF